MNEQTLTPAPIENLAKPLIGLAGKILSHYKNPEHEKAFQDWYSIEYGNPATGGV